MLNKKNYYLWQPAGDGARLLKVFGTETSLVLPEMIDEKPITEIGPYCFADRMPAFDENVFLDESSVDYDGLQARMADMSLPPALTGRAIESVRLPSTVSTLYNAAFYNCRSLKALSVGPGITGIGSDVFTNDTRLALLALRSSDQEKTGLPLFLERIPDNLTVRFRQNGQVISSLFFPEYYEWLDEVMAAHLFSRSVHGEGFRMRKVFSDRKLSYDRYDSFFPRVMRNESPVCQITIALNRLRYPASLSDDAGILYRKAVEEHLGTAMACAVKHRDTSLLAYLIESFKATALELDSARDLAIESEWGEGAARIIAARQALGTMNNYDLEW